MWVHRVGAVWGTGWGCKGWGWGGVGAQSGGGRPCGCTWWKEVRLGVREEVDLQRVDEESCPRDIRGPGTVTGRSESLQPAEPAPLHC